MGLIDVMGAALVLSDLNAIKVVSHPRQTRAMLIIEYRKFAVVRVHPKMVIYCVERVTSKKETKASELFR